MDDLRTVVVSYRPVFDFERRWYGTDQFRWPSPHGLPIAAILYFAAAELSVLVLSRLPLTATLLGALPWTVRWLVLPGAVAWLLTVVRVEGRPIHRAGLGVARHWLAPRVLVGLRPARAATDWRPRRIVLLPDGRETGDMRAMRVRGPARIATRVPARARRRGRRLRLTQTGRRPLARGKVLTVRAGGTVELGR